MSQILKILISTIGLANLFSYIWDIVRDELYILAQKSDSKWDDKAVEYLDLIISQVLKELPLQNKENPPQPIK